MDKNSRSRYHSPSRDGRLYKARLGIGRLVGPDWVKWSKKLTDGDSERSEKLHCGR